MGAPGGPPRKSGTNWGLIIGLGCGGLLVVSLIIGGLVYALADAGDDSDTEETKSAAASPATATDETPTKPTSGGKVELKDIRFFKARGSRKTIYVVGELVNTGSGSVNAPRAKITVYDASKTALDSTVCAAFVVHDLQPGEKVPCYSVMNKAAGWKTYKVETEHSKLFVRYRAADLKISGVDSVSPRSRFGAHKVTGKVTNKSSFTAKSVWVVVGLYDAKGKIVGAGKTLVAGHDLDSGASGKFTVSIYSVAGTPKKSLTKVFGYDK